MELTLSPYMTIRQLVTEFQARFPYLSLAFFEQDNDPDPVRKRKEQVLDHVRIGGLIGNFLPTVFEYEKTEKLSEIEKRFKKEFGLLVKIFRKENDIWVEPKLSAGFSLEEQNAIGALNLRRTSNRYTLFL